jgi:glycosyltransferase involved in cell wall biosynthesis
MSLTVLQVAFPLAAVGEDAAGGAEQVLSLLDRGLSRLGHRSIVVACSGSRVEGELVATEAVEGPIDDAAWRAAHARTRDAIEAVLARRRVDLVHLHGVDFRHYVPAWSGPVLVTLHLPPSFYPAKWLRPASAQVHLACVSRSQLRACPPEVRIAAVVENGVDVRRLAGYRREGRGRYVAALGRICPEKGLHLALEAARRAAAPCRLAGRLFPFPEHERYFEREIAPRLDAERVFVGALGFAAKRRFLAEARCLLLPSRAPETSSLVAMEALACGTPVVAFRAGALAEIVEHGRTGLLVSGVDEMAAAIDEVSTIDPEVCRAAARERFSAAAMVDGYVGLYRQLAPARGSHAA